MNENRVVPLRQPEEIDDPLTEILRCGAKRLVQQAPSLSARRFHWRRLSGRPDGPARQGCAQSFAFGDRAAEGRLGGRLSALASQRSVGATLCLYLGRRRLSAGADGAAGRMHSRTDWRDPGGQKGASGLADGHAGKRPELEGTACRSKGAGDRRWLCTLRSFTPPRRSRRAPP